MDVEFKKNIKDHWNYFFKYENELMSSKKYVEFHAKNYNTFSDKYFELLMLICSEIENVSKFIVRYFDKDFDNIERPVINDWGYIILTNLKPIVECNVCFNDEVVFNPWLNLLDLEKNATKRANFKKGKKSPSWWLAYNNVKHDKDGIDDEIGEKNYTKANLKNVFYALAALYLLNTTFIEFISKNSSENINYEKSKLFNIVAKN